MTSEKDYFKPDYSWEIFGISSEEEYELKFGIKGKFHDLVPNIIKEEFVNVEYLAAYSYYRIQLYNEAFNKCMRILEIAVKQKSKQLDIKTEFSNGKEKTLNLLLNEICEFENYQSFKSSFDWLRKLRNMEMHPFSDGSILGAFFSYKSKMIFFINIINEFFQEEKSRQDGKNQIEIIESQSQFLNENYCLLKVNKFTLL